MSTEAQTCAIGILANRHLGRRIVLNLDHLYLPALRSPQGEGWVSDFDIRISDFNHSGCFMQNKSNSRKSQMNVNPYNTTDYENIANWTFGENKPNSKPIKANQTQYKPNCRKGIIDAKCVFTKDYKEKCG